MPIVPGDAQGESRTSSLTISARSRSIKRWASRFSLLRMAISLCRCTSLVLPIFFPISRHACRTDAVFFFYIYLDRGLTVQPSVYPQDATRTKTLTSRCSSKGSA
jgi:hypothetical protein